MAAPAVSASADTQAAWQEYLETLTWAREQLMGHTRCRDEGDRARAMYDVQMLATTGFNFYMAPRRTHPSFYIHQVFMPFEIAWGQPCPDFLYRWAFVGGRNTYRVWGERGTTTWAEIQVLNGFWGDPQTQNVTNIDLSDHAGEDGRFELFFSPDAKPGEKNWIQIPRDSRNVVLQSREAWWDWENDVGLKMFIEPVTLADAPEWTFSEAETNRRIRETINWIRYNIRFNIDRISEIQSEAGGRNRFKVKWDGLQGGGHPNALKGRMIFDIAPDEALIVEVDTPKAVYWAYSIGDIWYQTPDYSYHQSSLNGHQTVPDSDGKVRYVMAHQDPGVANWIDTVGLTQGMVNFRFYLPLDGYEPKPVVTKVKHANLMDHLPRDTPMVSPHARAETVKRRARASLARYGY